MFKVWKQICCFHWVATSRLNKLVETARLDYTWGLLPTGSLVREVLDVGGIPVAILPSCQYIQTIALTYFTVNKVG